MNTLHISGHDHEDILTKFLYIIYLPNNSDNFIHKRNQRRHTVREIRC